MPDMLTILGLLRAMLGVLLTVVGFVLVIRVLRRGWLFVYVTITAIVNFLPFLTLILPMHR